MPTPRDVLTPSALAMLQVIADTGSFAAAARAGNMVPSALTYRVRQTGQDVFTVADMRTKVEAQVRGLGAGFLPTCLAQPYLDTGRLVAKRMERAEQQIQSSYAWRKGGKAGQGRALQWWLEQLQTPVTRSALLGERCRVQ